MEEHHPTAHNGDILSCPPILLGNLTVLTNSMSRYKRTPYQLDFATVPVTAAVHLSLTAGASDSSFCTACPIATYSSSSGEFARRARLDSERRHSLTPSLKGTLLQPLGRQPPTTLGCVWAGLVYGSSRERPFSDECGSPAKARRVVQSGNRVCVGARVLCSCVDTC
jgi:hypothetical protein